MDIYKVKAVCENCDTEWIEQVPMGQTSKGFLKCPYCGCRDGRSQGRPSAQDLLKEY